MARDYAAMPHEYLEEMAELDDAEFGRLTRALLLCAYAREGVPSGAAVALTGWGASAKIQPSVAILRGRRVPLSSHGGWLHIPGRG